MKHLTPVQIPRQLGEHAPTGYVGLTADSVGLRRSYNGYETLIPGDGYATSSTYLLNPGDYAYVTPVDQVPVTPGIWYFHFSMVLSPQGTSNQTVVMSLWSRNTSAADWMTTFVSSNRSNSVADCEFLTTNPAEHSMTILSGSNYVINFEGMISINTETQLSPALQNTSSAAVHVLPISGASVVPLT